jgi:hypothetical protein
MIPKIKYECADGSDTEAKSPSIALMHWLGRQMPMETPRDKVYVGGLMRVGPPVPGPQHKAFFTTVFAAIERRWNKSCDVDVNDYPDMVSFMGDEAEQIHEIMCLDILKWLEQHGDIRNLVVEEIGG